jgi:thioredoxin-related protein
MGTVTYPNEKVEAELNERFIPVKLVSADHADLARKMNVRWLPGLVVCDADGRPAHVVIGYLPPSDFRAELAFGRAIIAMGEKRYEDSYELFRGVAEGENERSAEAYYWWGIAAVRHKKSNDAYREHWQKIVEKFPKSQTARKVAFVLQKLGSGGS